ncbi:hypothetical protein CEUSTIGMA_g11676.t1 [Chlamydomonas eustigma]|uniref:Uncharacterized protein n=1 Tax=Chlamydomonas eustigma TaxID=1157962 RepID=A0A250XMK3_9CHLO|nr:hypothetical protein CEUSTIGMA_g11676.t1 [Chlamydomonas eustigma]|eukprot:GAX84253.1 hypothetical protein CEUSTIGMA_g11676.t1 [Chlamydomonas eustigma]
MSNPLNTDALTRILKRLGGTGDSRRGGKSDKDLAGLSVPVDLRRKANILYQQAGPGNRRSRSSSKCRRLPSSAAMPEYNGQQHHQLKADTSNKSTEERIGQQYNMDLSTMSPQSSYIEEAPTPSLSKAVPSCVLHPNESPCHMINTATTPHLGIRSAAQLGRNPYVPPIQRPPTVQQAAGVDQPDKSHRLQTFPAQANHHGSRGGGPATMGFTVDHEALVLELQRLREVNTTLQVEAEQRVVRAESDFSKLREVHAVLLEQLREMQMKADIDKQEARHMVLQKDEMIKKLKGEIQEVLAAAEASQSMNLKQTKAENGLVTALKHQLSELTAQKDAAISQHVRLQREHRELLSRKLEREQQLTNIQKKLEAAEQKLEAQDKELKMAQRSTTAIKDERMQALRHKNAALDKQVSELRLAHRVRVQQLEEEIEVLVSVMNNNQVLSQLLSASSSSQTSAAAPGLVISSTTDVISSHHHHHRRSDHPPSAAPSASSKQRGGMSPRHTNTMQQLDTISPPDDYSAAAVAALTFNHPASSSSSPSNHSTHHHTYPSIMMSSPTAGGHPVVVNNNRNSAGRIRHDPSPAAVAVQTAVSSMIRKGSPPPTTNRSAPMRSGKKVIATTAPQVPATAMNAEVVSHQRRTPSPSWGPPPNRTPTRSKVILTPSSSSGLKNANSPQAVMVSPRTALSYSYKQRNRSRSASPPLQSASGAVSLSSAMMMKTLTDEHSSPSSSPPSHADTATAQAKLITLPYHLLSPQSKSLLKSAAPNTCTALYREPLSHNRSHSPPYSASSNSRLLGAAVQSSIYSLHSKKQNIDRNDEFCDYQSDTGINFNVDADEHQIIADEDRGGGGRTSSVLLRAQRQQREQQRRQPLLLQQPLSGDGGDLLGDQLVVTDEAAMSVDVSLTSLQDAALMSPTSQQHQRTYSKGHSLQGHHQRFEGTGDEEEDDEVMRMASPLKVVENTRESRVVAFTPKQKGPPPVLVGAITDDKMKLVDVLQSILNDSVSNGSERLDEPNTCYITSPYCSTLPALMLPLTPETVITSKPSAAATTASRNTCSDISATQNQHSSDCRSNNNISAPPPSPTSDMKHKQASPAGSVITSTFQPNSPGGGGTTSVRAQMEMAQRTLSSLSEILGKYRNKPQQQRLQSGQQRSAAVATSCHVVDAVLPPSLVPAAAAVPATTSPADNVGFWPGMPSAESAAGVQCGQGVENSVSGPAAGTALSLQSRRAASSADALLVVSSHPMAAHSYPAILLPSSSASEYRHHDLSALHCDGGSKPQKVSPLLISAMSPQAISGSSHPHMMIQPLSLDDVLPNRAVVS